MGVRPLKNKYSQSVTDAFKLILNEEIPLMLQSDKVSECTVSVSAQRMRYSFLYLWKWLHQSRYCKRFNRTLKTRMDRHFTYSKSSRYVNVFQDLVYSYNHTHHRSIGMEPAMVTPKNEQRVRRKLFHFQPEKPKWLFKSVNKWESVEGFWKGTRSRLVGRGFYRQQYIFHHSCNACNQRLGRLSDNRKVLRTRASVGHQGGQRVWRLEGTQDEKAKRQSWILRQWKGYPDKFNSANDGNSAGLNSQRKKYFISVKCLSYRLLWSIASSTYVYASGHH